MRGRIPAGTKTAVATVGAERLIPYPVRQESLKALPAGQSFEVDLVVALAGTLEQGKAEEQAANDKLLQPTLILGALRRCRVRPDRFCRELAAECKSRTQDGVLDVSPGEDDEVGLELLKHTGKGMRKALRPRIFRPHPKVRGVFEFRQQKVSHA